LSFKCFGKYKWKEKPSQSFKVFASFHLFRLTIHLQISILVSKDPSCCFTWMLYFIQSLENCNPLCGALILGNSQIGRSPTLKFSKRGVNMHMFIQYVIKWKWFMLARLGLKRNIISIPIVYAHCHNPTNKPKQIKTSLVGTVL
jgi:hypothetical protein